MQRLYCSKSVSPEVKPSNQQHQPGKLLETQNLSTNLHVGVQQSAFYHALCDSVHSS